MINTIQSKAVTTLEDVKAAFTHWRKTRVKRDKIPEALWDQALLLLDHYNQSQVLHTLGISQSQLRKEKARREPLQVNKLASTAVQFVEVDTASLQANITASPHANEAFDLEFKRQDGGTLSIKGFPLLSMNRLLNDFYGVK